MERFQLGAPGGELIGVVGHQHAAEGFEFLCGMELVIVDMFPVAAEAGKDDQGFASLEGGIDTSNAGVADQSVGALEGMLELIPTEDLHMAEVAGLVLTGADLGEDLLGDGSAGHGVVDGADQAIETEEGADGEEEHGIR
jgi:hypothetical protein